MTRTGLALQKCFNHPAREAVARCPECTRSFCRECVVEHEDRIICAGCLARIVAARAKVGRSVDLSPLWRGVAAIAGLFVAWFLFFTIGRSVLSVPDDYHAGKVWKEKFQPLIHDD
jgi:hypothetical protein